MWWAIKILKPGEKITPDGGRGWVQAQAISTANVNSGLAGMPSAVPTGPWLTAQVNAEILAGPGSKYGTVGVLLKGEGAALVGKNQNGAWWVVRVPYTENGQGWVAADQVVVQGAENLPVLEPPDESRPTAVPGEPATIRAVVDVNIRAGPDTRYEKIGVLANGQVAEVIGVSEDGFWWRIRQGEERGGQGWVSVDYVVASNAENVPVYDPLEAAKARIPPTPAAGAPMLTAKVTVNIRAGPSRDYGIVGNLEQGQIAEVVGRTDDGLWWVIKMPSASNGQGYVAAAYVTAANADNVPVIK
jgi:uncharacterized protein YraI